MIRANDKDRIIDADGFRPNVGIVVANAAGQVLWGKRIRGKDSWQFPQGGIHPGETPEQAMYRELDEEVGLKRSDVSILAVTRSWHRYRLPARYVRRQEQPVCIGQKQKWFLLRLNAPDSAVRLDAHEAPEFVDWRWVSFWYPLNAVVDFKRDVYRGALSELISGLGPRRKRKRKRGKARD